MESSDRIPRVLIQSVGRGKGRYHYQNTMATPVAMSRVEDHVSDAECDQLGDQYPSQKLYVWGVTPAADGRGRTKWEKISQGDFSLFGWDGRFRSCARVVTTTENAELARELWGADEDGQTWRLIYFLTEPHDCNIPYERFNEAVGYKRNNVPQGLSVLDDEKSKCAIQELGLRDLTR